VFYYVYALIRLLFIGIYYYTFPFAQVMIAYNEAGIV